jgi:hypothetical protein
LSVDFRNQALKWLAEYKLTVLGVHENGIWLRNRREYAHILPVKLRSLNILPDVRDEFWKWFRRPSSGHVSLHTDFHHLNSSQALCFNLFWPILSSRQLLSILLPALEISGCPDHSGAAFEFQPNRSEGTNFDFMLPLKSGERVYFEIKYSESRFASAKMDEKHIVKFNSVYSSLIQNKFEERYSGSANFLKNYQILRNIWHLRSGDYCIFLFPAANRHLLRSEKIIEACSVEPFKSHVKIVYTENLIKTILLKTDSDADRELFKKLWFKYFAFVSASP